MTRTIVEIPEGLPAAEFKAVSNCFASLRWEFSIVSDRGSPWTFWCVPFASLDERTGALQWRWGTPRVVRRLCRAGVAHAARTLGGKPILRRFFLNGQTYGQDGSIHQDCSPRKSSRYTLLFYPCAEWQPEWEGETVFFEPDGRTVARCQAYLPNTFLLFDSGIKHVGRAPSRICPALRITAAWRFEVV